MRIALLLGDAACVHADAAAAYAMLKPDAIAATNCIGFDWPGRVDYWFTLHPKSIGVWPGMPGALRRRENAGLNRPQTWAHKSGLGIDRHTPDWGGSTGLLAVKGLRQLRFNRIVLAGVPMSPEQNHYYEGTGWSHATHYRKGWREHRDEIAPFVRSMSGWTREIFGAPTAEWLTPDPTPAGPA